MGYKMNKFRILGSLNRYISKYIFYLMLINISFNFIYAYSQQALPINTPESEKINLKEIDKTILNGIKNKIFPGASVLIWYKGKVIYNKAFGRYTYDLSSPYVTTKTLFDLASLTKPIVTTTAAMILHDRNLLSIDKPACYYLPKFGNKGKEKILISNLLNHNSGLPHYIKENESLDLMDINLINEPGSKVVYGCLNMIILQKIIEKITGLSIDKFITKELFKPLGMNNTQFNPPNIEKCAPTSENHQGIVHDRIAYNLGGVAGNSGLFSNTKDLALFMTMMMNYGHYTDINGCKKQLIKASAIQEWTTDKNNNKRGYGWEIGRHISDNSFGHFGFSGTSIWADRGKNIFCILLTNRIYKSDDNSKMKDFRILFHEVILNCINQ